MYDGGPSLTISCRNHWHFGKVGLLGIPVVWSLRDTKNSNVGTPSGKNNSATRTIRCFHVVYTLWKDKWAKSIGESLTILVFWSINGPVPWKRKGRLPNSSKHQTSLGNLATYSWSSPMRRCTQVHGGEFQNSLVKRLHQGNLGKDGGCWLDSQGEKFGWHVMAPRKCYGKLSPLAARLPPLWVHFQTFYFHLCP